MINWKLVVSTAVAAGALAASSGAASAAVVGRGPAGTVVAGSAGAFVESRPGCGYNPCSVAYLRPYAFVSVQGTVIGGDGMTYDVVTVADALGRRTTGYVAVSRLQQAPPRPTIGWAA